MTYSTMYLGIRDCCRKVQTFTSEPARAEWEADPHPHGEDEDGDTE